MVKKVLIIDDDPVGIQLMMHRLSQEGYLVLTERNGRAGLETLKKENPNAVVLDIEMPEMNGYTFVFEMKKDDAVKDIPVIVQTAHEENRAIFLRRGIKHYLVKPLQFDLLLGKLKEVMGE